MATVKRCDRCGRHYDDNKRGNAHIRSRYVVTMNQVTVTGEQSFLSASSKYSETYDLCDECVAEFVKFMGIEKEEK